MIKKYLSFDVGLKHTGVATNSGTLAYPLVTLECADYPQQLREVSLLIDQQRPDILLFGLPSRGVAKKRVEMLIKDLGANSKKPMITIDERLSSVRAQDLMKQANVGHAKRVKKEHSVVASLLLQDYIDSLG